MPESNNRLRSAILLIHCADQPGVVAAVAEFIHENRGNIVDLDEHVDASNEIFYMRVEWSLDEFAIRAEDIGERFQTLIATRFNMTWGLRFSHEVPRMAIFVSKLGHCLYDLLSRWQSGEWRVEIPLVVSNHRTLEPVAGQFGIDFRHVPVRKGEKEAAEREQLHLLLGYDVEFVVLARYMLILCADFI